MKENLTRKMIWDQAGITGLVLGAVLSIAMIIDRLLIKIDINPNIVLILSALMLSVRIFGYIVGLIYFTRKFNAENNGLDRKQIYRFGRASALLAAFVFACASFADAAYLSADIFLEQYRLSFQMMEPLMDANTKNSMDVMLSHIPELISVSNFINTFILGTLLALIISRKYPPSPANIKD